MKLFMCDMCGSIVSTHRVVQLWPEGVDDNAIRIDVCDVHMNKLQDYIKKHSEVS